MIYLYNETKHFETKPRLKAHAAENKFNAPKQSLKSRTAEKKRVPQKPLKTRETPKQPLEARGLVAPRKASVEKGATNEKLYIQELF